jgi:1,2-diacylglycerol 3-beta-galactosyltransferase
MSRGSNNSQVKRRILILTGLTGGGHLRAAEAVAEALRRSQAEDVNVQILDALGRYGPFPFSRLADIYPWWIDRAAVTWDWSYTLTDGKRRATALLRLFWPLVWPGARRLFNHYPADVIVSTHPLTNHYAAWALRRLRRATPTVTLATDPVSVHPFWLSLDIGRCLVGSDEARQRALQCGLSPDQVRVTGLPVSPCFVDGLVDKGQARRRLGWALGRPMALLLGGGEGMGRVFETACAIDAVCSGLRMVVVAGRNQRLKERLDAVTWRLPTTIHGFVDHVREMPRLMSAADILITKAGPGSLHEAFLAGLPLILTGAIPGQEDGNVRLVVEGGAGVWAPDPSYAADLVARWTGADNDQLVQVAACSRALARPDAASAVADEVWQLALTNL